MSVSRSMVTSPWNLASNVYSRPWGARGSWSSLNGLSAVWRGLWLLSRNRQGSEVASPEKISVQRLPDGGLVRSQRMARLEAALLISGQAVSPRRLAQLARLEDAGEVQQIIQVLNESYDRDRTAFRVEQTAAGYLLMTRAQYAPWLDRLHQRQAAMKLSSPAMETLTIIAYQQPVTRADVEAVRGVQSSEMIRQLIDRGLVRVAGEDDSLGRPFLYETTRQFLSMFGLQRLEDMPNHATLRRYSGNLVTGVLDEQGTDEQAADGEGIEDGEQA